MFEEIFCSDKKRMKVGIRGNFHVAEITKNDLILNSTPENRL